MLYDACFTYCLPFDIQYRKKFLETLRFFVYSFVAVLVEFVDMCLPVGWPGGRPHCTAPASQPEKLGPETS